MKVRFEVLRFNNATKNKALFIVWDNKFNFCAVEEIFWIENEAREEANRLGEQLGRFVDQH